MPTTPEQEARAHIDANLAVAGWIVDTCKAAMAQHTRSLTAIFLAVLATCCPAGEVLHLVHAVEPLPLPPGITAAKGVQAWRVSVNQDGTKAAYAISQELPIGGVAWRDGVSVDLRTGQTRWFLGSDAADRTVGWPLAMDATGDVVVFAGPGGRLWRSTAGASMPLPIAWDPAWQEQGLSEPVLSANGKVLMFTAVILGQIPSGPSPYFQVYGADLDSGAVWLVSRTPAGAPSAASAHAYCGSLSADGNRMAFYAAGDDLVPRNRTGDLVDWPHVYDRRAGAVLSPPWPPGSRRPDGAAPVLSRDGRFLTFHSWATVLADHPVTGDKQTRPAQVYLWDIDHDTVRHLGQGWMPAGRIHRRRCTHDHPDSADGRSHGYRPHRSRSRPRSGRLPDAERGRTQLGFSCLRP